MAPFRGAYVPVGMSAGKEAALAALNGSWVEKDRMFSWLIGVGNHHHFEEA